MKKWFAPQFTEFAKIPNLNPSLDKDYLTNDHLQTAMHQIHKSIADLDLKGISTRTFNHPKTGIPMVIYVIEPTHGSTKNYMFYGHIDKRPFTEGQGKGVDYDQKVIDEGVAKGEFIQG